MFALRVDDDVEIELAEEHHAQSTFDLIDANRDHLRRWMPWVDGTATVADSVAFLRFARGEYAAGRMLHANLRFRGEHVGRDRAGRARPRAPQDRPGLLARGGPRGAGDRDPRDAALRHAAFTQLGLNRVAIKAAVDNVRSRAVPDRLGFTFEGVLRGNEKVGHRFVDHAAYAMLAAHWPGR